MKHVLGMLPEEIESLFLELGEKKFRAKQFTRWVFANRVLELNKMTNLSPKLYPKLDRIFDLGLPEIKRISKSEDGSRKYALALKDKLIIEMVIMPSEEKTTLCISSQVGCRRACSFCATAAMRLKRNLEVHEIVAQVFIALNELNENERLTNIVFMGMGEPLDNFDNVMKAVDILRNESGFQFSPRRITISTCGVIPGIRKLINSKVKVKLAVSLNSAIDSKRTELMPVNKQYPLDDLKKVLIDYTRNSKFRVTFEYILIKNKNMEPEDIKALKKYTGDISCKINLIPWNNISSKKDYMAPASADVDNFAAQLKVLSAAITVRQSKGQDIAAACGQLAAKTKT